ncbi:hypothetical protein QQ045_020976 [Rhodiola kirilowii]
MSVEAWDGGGVSERQSKPGPPFVDLCHRFTEDEGVDRFDLKHVPGFIEKAGEFKFKGIDDLIAMVKGLDVDALFISHIQIQVNQAQKQRRRTYRAHGRINRKFIRAVQTSISVFHSQFYIRPLPETQLAAGKSKKGQALCSGASS